tara:strand:- start:9676 stop:10161 length:486 start_codon:yes stop_codon:yes gene_type:complete
MKIVVFGMSCVGKTTYAKSLNIPYLCFDYLFPWPLVESFPELSIEKALAHVVEQCEKEENYVLDGWHLSDIEGNTLPKGCEIHVLYDHHQNIIDRYRNSVVASDEHREMYRKWYGDINDSVRTKFFRIHCGEAPEPRTFEHFNSFRELEWVRLAEAAGGLS